MRVTIIMKSLHGVLDKLPHPDVIYSRYNLSKPEKIRASTRFEPVTSANTGATLYQLSYELLYITYNKLISVIIIKMNYFMCTSRHFTPHGRYELDKLTSLPMCGFRAHLVEHRTGIAEVTGSNSVEALIFSDFFFPIA